MKFLQPLRVAVKSNHHPNFSRWRPRIGPSFTPSIRGFHATSRRPFLDECLIQTHSLIEGLHNATGLAWAATIPMTAVFVTGVFRAPLLMYEYIVVLRKRKLEPQLLEQHSLLYKLVLEKHAGKSASEKQQILDAAFAKFCRTARKQARCQNWKTYIKFTQYPAWYLVMETLRQMTGTQDGFFRLAGRAFKGSQGLESRFVDTSVVPVEQSLATEGAMWFHSLLLPDPNLILPFVLSGVLFFSAFKTGIHTILMPTLGATGRIFPFANWINRNSMRVKKIFPLAAGPLTLQFPSAMLLYWVSSSVCTIGFGYVLRWWNPLKPPATPTKAPAKKQQYRGPTMQDLRSPKKGKR